MKKLLAAGLLFFCACHTVDIKYQPQVRRSNSPIRDVVEELFSAYEMEDGFAFDEHVSRDFSDATGSATNDVWFSQAVRDDFLNLTNPTFTVYVESVEYFEDHTICRVRMRWFRRAYVPFGAQEWETREQDSALIFRNEDGVWKLWRIEGAPIFGISDGFGVIRVTTGTVNGAAPGSGAKIVNGKYQP